MKELQSFPMFHPGADHCLPRAGIVYNARSEKGLTLLNNEHASKVVENIVARSLRILLSVCVLLCVCTVRVGAQEPALADLLRSLIHPAQEGIEAAERNDVAAMRTEYTELHERWETIEDQVRETDSAGYADIEGAISTLGDAVNAQPVVASTAKAAFEAVEHETDEVIERVETGTTSSTPVEATMPATLSSLDEAAAALAQGNATAAQTELDGFARAWPGIEGAVAAKSQDAYQSVEHDLTVARAALRATPADVAAATAAVGRMQEQLAPFREGSTYTAFDAAAIILREGLEALLVIVALLAFLRKSGNASKRGWIWAGGALGVLVSIATAFALQAIFSRVSAGTNRELIEGVTGLVAAGLLFYVSYWLHSKASMGAWRTYIDQRTTQALARSSMLGLALLSFLAVFREGAETAIFYLGMAPSISTRDLLIGIAVGVVILLIVATLILVLGVKLPIRQFFRVAGLLVYYLGFKFVGTGLHSLQVAGTLPASPIPGFPSHPILEFFGIFPTWQTLLPQLALLLGAIVVWMYLRTRETKLANLATT